MKPESEILIYAPAQLVFECIINPQLRVRWMPGLVTSTFNYEEFLKRAVCPAVYKEVVKTSQQMNAVDVTLLCFEPAENLVFSHRFRRMQISSVYMLKSIGMSVYVTLQHDINSSAKGIISRLLHFSSNFGHRSAMKKELEALKQFAENKNTQKLIYDNWTKHE